MVITRTTNQGNNEVAILAFFLFTYLVPCVEYKFHINNHAALGPN